MSTTGLVTAVAAGGPVTITATSEGQSGTSSITVTLAHVASVTVALATSSITAVGTSQATATIGCKRHTLTGRAVTWSPTTRALPRLTPGLVTAVAPGSLTITATSEPKSGSAP